MTKPLFTLRDSWPWAALTAVALLILALAAFYGHGSTIAYAVAFSSAGAMLGLVALHFWRRWQEVDRWNRAPKIGCWVAVLSPATVEQLGIVFLAPVEVVDVWFRYMNNHSVKTGNGINVLFDALNGCDITFTAEPWTHNGVLVGGIQDGEHITVVGPEFAGIERTRALIVHELSHRALTALGIPAGVNGENHHRIFAEEGLGA